MKALNIVHIASEVDPFTKTGGLGDVARSLPRALSRLKHHVSVFTPFYKAVDYTPHQLEELMDFEIPLPDGTTVPVKLWRGWLLQKLPVYFVEQDHYFGARRGIYGSEMDNQRFYVFSVAVLEAMKRLGLAPDIIHCHDWHTGLIPYLVRNGYRQDFPDSRLIFTIHNLAFQFGHNWWSVPGELRDHGHSALPEWRDKEAWERLNFAKRGIQRADYITTVSEQYAEEILTKDFGQDLHRILMNRKDRFSGIINGLDYKDFNPVTDPGLAMNYDMNTLDRKYDNKRALQRAFGLPERSKVPLIGMVSRLSEQKGFDLLLDILDPLLRLDVQLVIMGGGDKEYATALKKAAKKHKSKMGVSLEFDAKRATQVYAGSDMFLMPSRFEPCGLGQMISLRYGSVPIVHATGGLADTIQDFNPRTGKGLGFSFKSYDSRDFLVAITRAVVNYKHPAYWRKLVEQGMKHSFSWHVPAEHYVVLYRKVMRLPIQE